MGIKMSKQAKTIYITIKNNREYYVLFHGDFVLRIKRISGKSIDTEVLGFSSIVAKKNTSDRNAEVFKDSDKNNYHGCVTEESYPIHVLFEKQGSL